MAHIFEYLIVWYYEDEGELDREIFHWLAESEEIARNSVRAVAEAKYPNLDYELTLISAY